MAERTAGQAGLFGWAFLFGVVVNVLMLTGPLYMLQVYDRVLAARSVETLVALSLIAGMAFLAMGVTDHVRGRILARAGARHEHAWQAVVFRAAAVRLAHAPADGLALGALRDLAAIRQVCAAPVMAALFDLPFTPLFVAAIFVF
ncbi:MAG TPA: type I secretion system permease/ATPase, partial [Paracoccaceae bacterium]|nr:type I secretion system permease/ATPase [Paracoccaceae bacterium]